MKKWLPLLLIVFVFENVLFAQVNWVTQTNPIGFGEQAMLGKVQFFNEFEGWISCGNGKLLHTTNSGINWDIINPFPADTVERFSDPSITMSWVGNSHGWIVGTLGGLDNPLGAVIYFTTNNGQNWQRKVLSSEAGTMGIQVQFIDENIGWVLLFNFSTGTPTSLKSTDGGNTWEPITDQGIFFFVDANNGWAYSGEGANGSEPPFKIHKTTDGGVNWFLQFSDSTSGSFNAIYFSDLNNGWVVGDAGKILKTSDGGTNWTFITNSGVNSAEHCKTVYCLNQNSIWISNKLNDLDQTPVLLHTTDGGTSWTTNTTPFGSQSGSNAIFSIFYSAENNGWITGDLGRIAWYTIPISVDDEAETVRDFYLNQNFPNPFNPSTKIRYSINNNQFVTLKVYDVLGKEIAVLVKDYKEAGDYEVNFDASGFSSGVYIYKLIAGDFSQTRKMILIK